MSFSNADDFYDPDDVGFGRNTPLRALRVNLTPSPEPELDHDSLKPEAPHSISSRGANVGNLPSIETTRYEVLNGADEEEWPFGDPALEVEGSDDESGADENEKLLDVSIYRPTPTVRSTSPPILPPSPGHGGSVHPLSISDQVRDHYHLDKVYGTHSNSNTPNTIRPTTPPLRIDRISINGDWSPKEGGFRCNYPFHMEQPFQTQYLLNSHANVPYVHRILFCSVQGCPRSTGGRGFNRKVEMMRHEYERHFAGYFCPFCPDKGHRYLRRSTLQRHVRVHHVDRDKDDALLNEVLSQRLENPRRRKMHAAEFEPSNTRDLQTATLESNFKEPGSYQNPTQYLERSNRDHYQDDAFLTAGEKSAVHSLEDPSSDTNDEVTTYKEDSKPPHRKDYEFMKEMKTEAGYEIDAVNQSAWEAKDLEDQDDEMEQNRSHTLPGTTSDKTNLPELSADRADGGMQSTEIGSPTASSREASIGLNTEHNAPESAYPPGPATDFGYASMGRSEDNSKCNDEDDARTVFTDNQDLDVPEDVKERLVTAFSGELIQQLQDFLGSVSDKTKLRNTLGELLKEYSLRLRIHACAGEQRHATTFVRHYRLPIATLVVNWADVSSTLDSELLDNEEEPVVPLKEDGITLAEKMQLWNTTKLMDEEVKTSSQVGGGTSLPENLQHRNTEKLDLEPKDDRVVVDQKDVVEHGTDDEDGNDAEDFVITHFPEAWQFLTGSHAYYWLLSRVRSEMLLSQRGHTVAENIRVFIIKGLASRPKKPGYVQRMSKAKFEISWALPRFLSENYDKEHAPRLSSLITLSGSGNDVQALTCGQYMSQVWPVTGEEVLSALQGALDQGPGQAHKAVMMDQTRITVEINESTVYAVIRGSESAIAEIGQQFAWLGAALRSSPSIRMASSTPRVTLSATAETTFVLDFELTEFNDSVSQMNGSCWRSLFRNPIIVEGYPILARSNGEQGLEIPLNIMAGLGQASRVTNFDGGLLMKGHSTMLCPTQRIKNSVMWHYLFTHDGTRLSYLSPSSLGVGRAPVHEVNASCLEYSRHFLGWTSSAEIYTGSKDISYDQIDWAGSSFASAGLSFEKFSIVAGNFVNGGVSFTKGSQDTPIHLSYSRNPYCIKIHHASNMKVVLYDVKDRRAWMVDGASALLHLTRTQLASSPYSESEVFRIDFFQHSKPSDGSSAAKKALLNVKNQNLLLFTGWTYKDLVESTYHVLEQIQDNQVRMMSTSAINLRFTPRDKLIGFGFRDIVSGQNILYPRVATLKPSGRGWVDLTRSINAITLIGKGFGELIRPAQNSNHLCKHWGKVPIGRDYLVACVSMLKEIACLRGDLDSDPLELADGIYWHKPEEIFASCACKSKSWKLGCERIQVLLPSLSVGSKRHPQPFDHINGAVIFGRSRRFRWFYPNEGNPMEGGASDSEPESGGESEFRDSGIGESSSSTSEPNISSNIGSSRSETSEASSGIPDATMSAVSLDPGNPNNTPRTDPETLPTIAPNSEAHEILQIPSRGVKRTLDKVKDTATQMFSRKKRYAGGVACEATLDVSSGELELTDSPRTASSRANGSFP